MNENKLKFHIIKLKNCKIIDSVLFRKDLLWVFKNMHTKLLQKIHDQLLISHLNNRWTIDLIQWFYYWSDHQVTVRQYIWNCHVCQRSKVSRNNINELHHSLLILQKRWKDITMNFITELSLLENYNIICTIICCFIKKHHYVFCHWEDDDISVEETVWMSEFKSMKVRVLQRIKNKHENYSSTLSSNSQTRIWIYENWDTESTRDFTVDSQKHWIYENFYRWFSETLSLQEFKSHTNFDISLMIRIQVIYDLQEISHELHVISLISLMMLELNLLSI